MSNRAITWVWENAPADITSTELLLLVAIADQADDDGRCFPSMPYLARKIRVHQDTADRNMRDLIERGMVERTLRTGRSNVYRLVMERSPLNADQAPTPPQNNPPADCTPPQNTGGSSTPPTPPQTAPPPPRKRPPHNPKEPSVNPQTSHAPQAGAAEDVLDLGITVDPPEPNHVQILVGAYADRVRGHASKSLLGGIGKTVKRLLETDGFEPALILAAIEEAAPRGARDLDRILAAPGGVSARFERAESRRAMFAHWVETAARIDARREAS